MSDATFVQINIINQNVFYSHRARFAESTPSQRQVNYARREEAVNDAKVVFLQSLDILLKELEHGYKLLKPIPVKVEQLDENNFVASFVAANVNASGDTWYEAALNLKSTITHLFDLLIEHQESLGKAPRRQLVKMKSFIKRDAE